MANPISDTNKKVSPLIKPKKSNKTADNRLNIGFFQKRPIKVTAKANITIPKNSISNPIAAGIAAAHWSLVQIPGGP